MVPSVPLLAPERALIPPPIELPDSVAELDRSPTLSRASASSARSTPGDGDGRLARRTTTRKLPLQELPRGLSAAQLGLGGAPRNSSGEPSDGLLPPRTPPLLLVPTDDDRATACGAEYVLGDGAQLDGFVAALALVPAFATLAHDELEALCRASHVALHARHHVIFREGTRSSFVAVLLAGRVAYTDAAGRTRELERAHGNSSPLLFGEEGGLSEAVPRFGTALSASDDCACVAIPRDAICTALRAPLRLALVAKLLRSARGLLRPGQEGDAVLAQLAPCFELVQCRKGETLIRQDEPADCMYVVAAGRLAVTIRRRAPAAAVAAAAVATCDAAGHGGCDAPTHADDDDDDEIVGRIGPHAGRSWFGEVALTAWTAERANSTPPISAAAARAPARRSASVVATSDVWLLRVGASSFARLVGCIPDLARRAALMRATLSETDKLRAHKAEREQVLRALTALEGATSGIARVVHSAQRATERLPPPPLPKLRVRLMTAVARLHSAHTANSTELQIRAHVFLGGDGSAGNGGGGATEETSSRRARKERTAAEADARAATAREGRAARRHRTALSTSRSAGRLSLPSGTR